MRVCRTASLFGSHTVDKSKSPAQTSYCQESYNVLIQFCHISVTMRAQCAAPVAGGWCCGSVFHHCIITRGFSFRVVTPISQQ